MYVCVCPACSDADLRSLASRLKDWFGVLHMDANRDLKISANDNGQGRKHMNLCTVYLCCVCVFIFFSLLYV